MPAPALRSCSKQSGLEEGIRENPNHVADPDTTASSRSLGLRKLRWERIAQHRKMQPDFRTDVLIFLGLSEWSAGVLENGRFFEPDRRWHEGDICN
jgi:hypothetical protein